MTLKMVSARTTTMAIEGHTEAVAHSIQYFLDKAMLVVMAMGFSGLVMVPTMVMTMGPTSLIRDSNLTPREAI